jgi:hypothetical protein
MCLICRICHKCFISHLCYLCQVKIKNIFRINQGLFHLIPIALVGGSTLSWRLLSRIALISSQAPASHDRSATSSRHYPFWPISFCVFVFAHCPSDGLWMTLYTKAFAVFHSDGPEAPSEGDFSYARTLPYLAKARREQQRLMVKLAAAHQQSRG